MFRFTFVRNPYSRTLSAFLDKICRRSGSSKGFYAWWQGSETPAFGDFCRYLDAGGLTYDIHWAPQTELLLLPIEAFDRIGKLETLEPDLTDVLQRIFGADAQIAGRAGPRSDANRALETHYDDAARAIVARLYARDFEAFGYDPDAI